jgi:hypothetical protein
MAARKFCTSVPRVAVTLPSSSAPASTTPAAVFPASEATQTSVIERAAVSVASRPEGIGESVYRKDSVIKSCGMFCYLDFLPCRVVTMGICRTRLIAPWVLHSGKVIALSLAHQATPKNKRLRLFPNIGKCLPTDQPVSLQKTDISACKRHVQTFLEEVRSLAPIRNSALGSVRPTVARLSIGR